MRPALLAASLFAMPFLASCAHKTAPAEIAQYPTIYVAYFGVNSADLTEDSYAIVQRAADAAARLHPQAVEIAGYSDGKGSEGGNYLVAQSRTKTVAKTLSEFGVDPASVTTLPMGSATDDFGPTGDRRVEILLIKDEGAAAGP